MVVSDSLFSLGNDAARHAALLIELEGTLERDEESEPKEAIAKITQET